jgi:hypothetical protein
MSIEIAAPEIDLAISDHFATHEQIIKGLGLDGYAWMEFVDLRTKYWCIRQVKRGKKTYEYICIMEHHIHGGKPMTYEKIIRSRNATLVSMDSGMVITESHTFVVSAERDWDEEPRGILVLDNKNELKP